MRVEEEPLDRGRHGPHRMLRLHSEVRVVTDNSVWLLRPTQEAAWYLRAPKQEGPRKDWEFTGGRLTDGAWMPMRRCWLFHPWGPDQPEAVRVLPGVGPINGFGVHTSGIETITGDFEINDWEMPLPDRLSLWHPFDGPDRSTLWLRLTDLEPNKEIRVKHRVEHFAETRLIRAWEIISDRADGYQALIDKAVGQIRWETRP